MFVFHAGGFFWGVFCFVLLEAARGSASHGLQQDQCVCVSC